MVTAEGRKASRRGHSGAGVERELLAEGPTEGPLQKGM